MLKNILNKKSVDSSLNKCKEKSKSFMQLYNIKKEIKLREKALKQNYTRLGKLVYDEFSVNNTTFINEKISSLYNEIEENIKDVENLNEQFFTYKEINHFIFTDLDNIAINPEDFKDFDDNQFNI